MRISGSAPTTSLVLWQVCLGPKGSGVFFPRHSVVIRGLHTRHRSLWVLGAYLSKDGPGVLGLTASGTEQGGGCSQNWLKQNITEDAETTNPGKVEWASLCPFCFTIDSSHIPF